MPLISSPRHTQRDLDAWAISERLDSVNADRLGAKLERAASLAVRDILAFLPGGRCYVGCSWGKDSVVLASLIARARLAVPVVWCRIEGVENPDCPLVRDTFLAAHDINYDEITVPYDAAAKRTSAPGFDIAAKRHGTRHISGVRGEEATYRAIRMRRWGVSTANTCAPIGNWSAEMVFAWLHMRCLPIHPAYAQTYGGHLDRGRIRVGALGGERGTGHGRREWEACYYPRELHQARSLISQPDPRT